MLENNTGFETIKNWFWT